jgi:hypothetical protein
MNIFGLSLSASTLSIIGILVGIFALLSFVLVLVNLWQIRTLRKNLRLLWGDKTGTDIESLLVQQVADIKLLDQEIQELFEISNRLRELGLRSIHKFAVKRFNPFKEVGSNQSFSLALLDGKNSGAVVSSLHTREGTRVYAKPIKEGEADGFPLTDEEREVIAEALGKVRTKKSKK